MRYKILSDGKQINIIAADEFFVEDYCTKNGYTFEKIIDPPPEPEPEPTLEERVEAMETGKAEQADVDELQEALDMILTGYTGEEAADEAGTAG